MPRTPVGAPDAKDRTAHNRIEQVAAALKNGKRSLLLMRGRCLEADGVEAAGRIAAKTGARIAA